MALGSIVGFWVVSLMLVITPGADWAYTISASLRHRSIVPAITGLMGGYAIITLSVALGAAALIESTPGAMNVLTVAGASYLAWLGMNNLRNPALITAGEDGAPDASVRSQVLRGVATSGLNPKALLLFLAMVPQFTDAQASWPVGTQLLVLGCIHMFLSVLVYTAVGTTSRALLRARPSAARTVSQFSGVILLLLAFGLLAEHLHLI